jgi:hypothetical protein
MTNEDELAIAHYMNWHYAEHEGIYYYDWDGRRQRNLDLNDAGLVVNELARNGEWREFYASCFPLFVATNPLTISHGFLNLWLFNADNFFNAFAAWRRTK